MEKMTKIVLLQFLKEAGFENVNTKALELFYVLFEEKMSSILISLNNFTCHAQRSKVILSDLENVINVSKLNDPFNSFPVLKFDEEVFHEKEQFDNGIASKIDKYIYIYEFMPNFPPTHTFKRSYIKEVKRNYKPEMLKIRLEQSMQAEKNLVKMMKLSKNLPKYVNFMDRITK